MILLPGLLFILWREPAQCLAAGGRFVFNGDIRQFAVAANTVYVATEVTLYQLNHDLTLVRNVTQRGVLKGASEPSDAQFYRTSATDVFNATFLVNVLLPFVENGTLISCGLTDNECGYCEVLDLRNISNVLYAEPIQVGPPRSSGASISFLVNVEKTSNETYILTGIQQHEGKSTKTSCSSGSDAVNLHNTNNNQRGSIFSVIGDFSNPAFKSKGNVQFVDGFQIDLIIYLFSNVPSGRSNKVRLIWLEGKTGKVQTLKSLRGATLSVSGGGEGSRLLASSVIAGGAPVLWSGVFSVDGGQTNTELAVFDISPDLTGNTDADPDFCSACSSKSTQTVGVRVRPRLHLLQQFHLRPLSIYRL